jgi:hypothetical protein
MPVTSTNFNPNNDTKYARHRSIFKGSRNQLRETVDALKATPGLNVKSYFGTPRAVQEAFRDDWGIRLNAYRRPPQGMEAMGQWVIDKIPPKLLQAAGPLGSDLTLVWGDLQITTGRRIGEGSGAGFDSNALQQYHGNSLLVLAFGANRFDIVLSKWGWGEGLKNKHHFYQWQARAGKLDHTVPVDDH